MSCPWLVVGREEIGQGVEKVEGGMVVVGKCLEETKLPESTVDCVLKALLVHGESLEELVVFHEQSGQGDGWRNAERLFEEEIGW